MPCSPSSGTGVHNVCNQSCALSSHRAYRHRPHLHIRLLSADHHLALRLGLGQGHSHYLMMIIGIYATLGVFLLMASRDPDAHKSIIWFTVWSSVVHGAIMAWQGFSDAAERGHLLGDVLALFLIAIVLGVLMQMGSSDRVMTATAAG